MSPSPLSSKIIAANESVLIDSKCDAIETFFAADYLAHVTDRDIAGGHDTVRKFQKLLSGAFTDLQVEVEILVESDTRVAWQRTLRGIQSGAFLGFPATNRPIIWRDMVTSRFENGLIAEDWVITDLAERLLLARKTGG